jgi:hypothetical protein
LRSASLVKTDGGWGEGVGAVAKCGGGVASCAGALVRHYPRKKVSIHLSNYIRGALDQNLVALGGPAKNEIAASILKDLPRDYDLAEFTFDDVEDSLTIDDGRSQPYVVANFQPRIKEGYPSTDYGLVVVTTRAAQDDRPVRTILCAGFTTYGTAAAADYLFTYMVRRSRAKLYQRLRIAPIGRRADFLVVVLARFSRGECIDIQPTFELRLRRRRQRVHTP